MDFSHTIYYFYSLLALIWLAMADRNIAELVDCEINIRRMTKREFLMLTIMPALCLFTIAWLMKFIFEG